VDASEIRSACHTRYHCANRIYNNNNNNNNNNNRKEGGRRLVQVEAAYKAEIINIAEYTYHNTKYKEDQFVSIVKFNESTQPNMNSIIKSAAKIIEELSQLNGNNDEKQDEMQHTKGRLDEVL
jgi:hypothetical protein